MKTTDEPAISETGEILILGTAERLVLPNAMAIFKGNYNRQASDLVIEGPDGAVFRIVGYYNTDTPADLFSENGAVLTADVVTRLAGVQNPLVFAQASLPAGLEPIGRVETLEGTAFSTRANGLRVALNVGDPVFQDDLVETADDSILGITFIDETVFSLSNNARMILDELVYEADGSENSMVMNLVQGTFVFVTGQVAPTGDMVVETPVATMGIRGTTPIVIIEGENGDTEFGILKDPDGNVGEYAIYDKITKQVIGRVVDEGTILQLDQVGGPLNTISVDPARLAERAEAQSNVYFLHTVARDRINTQQQNDNSNVDSNAPNDGGSSDPITTESIGDQSSLESSGLTKFAFDPGFGESGGDESVAQTNSNDSGPKQQQTAGSIQRPGDFVSSNTPPVASDQTFLFDEDVEVAEASLSVSDGSASLIYTIVRQPEFGAVVVNTDGTFTYIADPIFNILQEGENTTVSFDFQASDNVGEISNLATVTLQILGLNDAPIASAINAGSTNEDAGAVTINLLSTTLDPDTGDTAGTLNVSASSSNSARSIAFSIDNNTGGFTVDPSQFENLAPSESEIITINYTIVDSRGASTTNTATMIVEGRDDAAITSGTMDGSIVENALEPTVIGDVNATDVDNLDDLWVAVSTPSASDNGFGSFTIDAAGNWAYTLNDGNPTVNGLGAGDELTDMFTVQTDGGTIQTISITIDGADDAAVITGTASGTIVEGAESNLAIGDLDATDLDDPDDTWIAVSAATAAVNGFGTYTIDTAGNWSFELDQANPVVDALNVGDVLSDLFTVETIGGTTQEVSITIEGSDDAAIITGAVSGTVVEDAPANTVNGNLDATDLDNPDDSWAVVNSATSSVNGFGSYTIDLSGNWFYTLSNENPTVDELSNGDMLTDTFTVQTVGGTLQTVSITIVGANDAAVITGSSIGTVIENAMDNTAAGDLDTNVIGDLWIAVGTETTSTNGFGTYTIDAAGKWIYSLDNTNPTVDSLGAGDTLSDVFTVRTVGGTNQTIVIHIEGAEDTPVVSSGAVMEDGIQIASGTLANTNGSVSTFVPQAGIVGAFGSFSLTTVGTWTYTLDNAAAQDLAAGQKVTESFDAQITDGLVVIGSQKVFVDISGTNDAPTLATGVASAEEAGPTIDVDLSSLGADIDSDDDGLSLLYSISGPPAVGSALIDGATLSFDPGSDFDDLALNETRDVVIQVTVADGHGDTAVNDVVVTVTGVDEPDTQLLGSWDVLGTNATTATLGSASISTDGAGEVSDTQIEDFLGISQTTLDSLSGGNAISGSAIQTTINIDSLSNLEFTYSFSGDDSSSQFNRTFRDFGFITIDGSPILLHQFSAGVSSIFDASFNILLSPGEYKIGFGALDFGDSILGATLTLNEVRITNIDGTEQSVNEEFALSATVTHDNISDTSGDHDLSLAELNPIIDAAIVRWTNLGLGTENLEYLQSVSFEIADLDGELLGLTKGEKILIDDDGAGHGWYIDPTPFDDAEFTSFLSETYLQAEAGQESNSGIDLLTTVLHELGHVLGLDHVQGAELGGDLLFGELAVGERRLVGDHHADLVTLVGQETDTENAPIAGDDGTAGEFVIYPGGTIDVLISELFSNDTDPNGEQFDLTDIFATSFGSATLEHVAGESVVRFTAESSVEDGAVGGFQYEITNSSGGVGFAAVDILIDDLLPTG